MVIAECLQRGFHIQAYYDLKDNTAYVIAALPERKNPNWIRSKLSKII